MLSILEDEGNAEESPSEPLPSLADRYFEMSLQNIRLDLRPHSHWVQSEFEPEAVGQMIPITHQSIRLQ